MCALVQVAATCVYIYCRQENKPYMLIDFSDQLSLNVYTLGATYLHLLRTLRLTDMSTFTKPVDPSLYLHRFADRLKVAADKKQVCTVLGMRVVARETKGSVGGEGQG